MQFLLLIGPFAFYFEDHIPKQPASAGFFISPFY
jgi:hypothetical protein